MIQNGEEAVSLRGIRKINSCKDEIQYFEPKNIQKDKVFVYIVFDFFKATSFD